MAFLSSALLHARLSAGYGKDPDTLHDVEFAVDSGEVLGLVGESGSGKSTIALALLRLLEHKGASIAGEILFGGRDLLRLRENEMRQIRGRDIALVLQSPLASLNPALRIGTQMAEQRARRSAPRVNTVAGLLAQAVDETVQLRIVGRTRDHENIETLVRTPAGDQLPVS